MVDELLYAEIDENVSDTPHVTMVFDEDMGTTEITTESVSDAGDIIDDYLLADISLLDEDVTITITFEDTLITTSDGEVELAESASQTPCPAYSLANSLFNSSLNVIPVRHSDFETVADEISPLLRSGQ